MMPAFRVHVWVDETRPRNQGAALTAWELGAHGVPHTVIADNAGGHLMQHGAGRSRASSAPTARRATGDVANKIGTYLKALAAHDNGVPFYVALPSSTIDWRLATACAEIPIEERSAREVTHLTGPRPRRASVDTVEVVAPGSPAANPAFDVTPARLVTGIDHRARRRAGEPRGPPRRSFRIGRAEPRHETRRTLRAEHRRGRAGDRPGGLLPVEVGQCLGAAGATGC